MLSRDMTLRQCCCFHYNIDWRAKYGKPKTIEELLTEAVDE